MTKQEFTSKSETLINANFTKIKDAEPLGEYKQTIVDIHKKEVDFLIIQTCPFYIRWSNGKSEIVAASKLAKLKKNHTWTTDF